MDVYILDQNFNIVAVEDCYLSLIWNERYNAPGDFELSVPATCDGIAYLEEDNYIYIPMSNKMMIIESHEPDSNVEDMSYVKYKGRSLESILDRRIVWQQTTVSGNVQNAIKTLITDAIINPSISSRKISNFVFETSTDSNVTSKTITETQFTGDNLLEVVETLCDVSKLGFQITLNSSKQFVFKLYSGIDRSKQQILVPQVEFSFNNDNLFSSKLRVDKKKYKNVTLIAGEGEGLDRKTATYGTASGLNRREYFTDARDISSNEGSEDEIPLTEYNNLLIERGKQKLADQIITSEIEADVDTSDNAMFKFQQDYFIGDLVENVDEFGVRSISRVTEMTLSISSNEFKYYPIFENEEIIEDELGDGDEYDDSFD